MTRVTSDSSSAAHFLWPLSRLSSKNNSYLPTKENLAIHVILGFRGIIRVNKLHKGKSSRLPRVIVLWNVNIPNRAKPFKRNSKLLRSDAQWDIADQKTSTTLFASSISPPRRRGASSSTTICPPGGATIRGAVPPHSFFGCARRETVAAAAAPRREKEMVVGRARVPGVVRRRFAMPRLDFFFFF